MIDPFAQRVVDFLDEIGIAHSELRYRGGSEKNVFDMHHRIESEKGLFYYELTGWVSRRLLTLWTFPMLQIPEERLAAIAEYAVRVNREEWYGYLDMEYAANSCIGFRTSLLCESPEPGFAVLKDWLDTNFGMIFIHTLFIKSILEGSAPAHAFQAFKSDLHREA